MRNLLEYPITKEEVLELLDSMLEGIAKEGRVGGIDGYVLKSIRDAVNEDFEPLNERLKISE